MKIRLLSCSNAHTGIGRYSQELHSYYLQEKLNSTYYCREKVPLLHSQKYFFPLPKNFRTQFGPFFLNKALTSDDSVTVHHADYVDSGSILNRKEIKSKIIITIHDAIPFIYPKNNSFKELYHHYLTICDQNADALIVVSEQSKLDVMKFTSIQDSKIHVIYNGINHSMFYPSIKTIPNLVFTMRYHGGLSMGHKNTQLLLHTAKLLEDRNISFRMELSGSNPNSSGLPKLAHELKLKNVFFTGFIPNQNLQSFLSGSDLFLYPSLYEGFGFPPLEAMACGVPVLSSNGGSLNEILSGSALLRNPDVEEFASTIEDLMNNSTLLNELKTKSIQKAAEFTWEKCAKKTIDLYQ